MLIKAIAPWFGSKRILGGTIAAQLGPHRAYWEPFCGSLAVLLGKPVCSQETVSDLHGDLINLARVLQEPAGAASLHDRLARSLVHEALYHEASARLDAQDNLDAFDAGALAGTEAIARAHDFFLCSWLGRNGVIGTRQYNNNFCVRYTVNGGIQGTRFVSAVESIPDWHHRLREVTILRRDGFGLLERIDDQPGTAIYCDPPYLQKGATYVHDFTSDDHARLAEVLRRFCAARVVVSYYDHPRLAELYHGWTKVHCPVPKAMQLAGKRGSKKETSPEVLLINGPSLAGADLFGGVA